MVMMFNYEYFKKKKTVIFLPHQDDELNTVYGMIDNIKKVGGKVKIVYSTNGDYSVDAEYRIKEAIKSLKVVNIESDNIIFLGYSDQAPENKNHLYNDNTKWISHSGISATYLPHGKEYHFNKYNEHATFNKENFANDLLDVIIDENPDIIIGIDYDNHCDHRALSLALEMAIGKYLKTSQNKPIVLKAFAYNNSYNGQVDYNNPNPMSIMRKIENPYYDWNKRVRLYQSKRATTSLLINNIYFKGLLQHHSQYIFNRIKSVVNSDMIFFIRNTGNLLNNSEIKVSSGCYKYLCDFMLYDTSDITNKDKLFDSGYTVIDNDDKLKRIDISFKKKVNVNCINIYTSLNSAKITKIIINNRECSFQYSNQIYSLYNLNLSDINKLSITLHTDNKQNIEIGELEVLENEDMLYYAKLSYNDNFIYNYEKKWNVSYSTNLNSKNFKLTNEKNTIKLLYNDKIVDQIKTRRFTFKTINGIIDNVCIFFGRVIQKIVKTKRKYKSKKKEVDML